MRSTSERRRPAVDACTRAGTGFLAEGAVAAWRQAPACKGACGNAFSAAEQHTAYFGDQRATQLQEQGKKSLFSLENAALNEAPSGKVSTVWSQLMVNTNLQDSHCDWAVLDMSMMAA